MPIFVLKSAEVTLTVRAACITCARNHAATHAGNEGPRVWRDNSLSIIEVQYGATGYVPTGKTEILNRS